MRVTKNCHIFNGSNRFNKILFEYINNEVVHDVIRGVRSRTRVDTLVGIIYYKITKKVRVSDSNIEEAWELL